MKRMTKLLAGLGVAALMTVGTVVITQPAWAAGLTEVTNFGDNPGRMKMHVYVPSSKPAKPAIVVAMHPCGGNGPQFYNSSEFGSLANKYGYIAIYPSAVQNVGFGTCFDTWSDAAKKRGGGSDPVSIVSMVKYVEKQYGGDPDKVFATGSSSGGMMTQHMLAVYPDVFKAGSGFMGVPFSCFANAADYAPQNSKCVNGKMNRTPQQWGDLVRNADPGFTGTRPRVQLWHGTADPLVPYQLQGEAIKQWTNVFGLSQTPTSKDSIKSGWNRQKFADSAGNVKVEAISVQGAGHALPQGGMALESLKFFGIAS